MEGRREAPEHGKYGPCSQGGCGATTETRPRTPGPQSKEGRSPVGVGGGVERPTASGLHGWAGGSAPSETASPGRDIVKVTSAGAVSPCCVAH